MSGPPLDILVVAPNAGSSFVEADVACLRERFRVELVTFRDYRRKTAYLRGLAGILRTQRPRLVLLWFLAPAYALETMALARLLGSRIALVVGGLEVDYVPELGLGGLRWPHNRLRQQLGLRRPDLVITPSRFLAERIARIARPRRIELVQLGIDTAHFSPNGRQKERLALTVCFEVTRETSPLKGLPTFLGSAAELVDVQFVVVGRAGGDGELERLARKAPPNVSFTGRVSDDELLDLYRRAKVYAQLSAHEAFGVAVVESMACGCVPVLAERGSLPEVAGDAALYVPYGSAEQTAAAIRAALALPEDAGGRGRSRVVAQFTIERRIARLVELLDPLVRPGGA